MKKILIFTAALLLSAAAFADKGYGRIQWKPIKAEEIVALVNTHEWWPVRLYPDEGDTGNRVKRCGYYYKSKDDGQTKYVLFNTGKSYSELRTSDYMIPFAIFYYLPHEKKQDIYYYFNDLQLLERSFVNFTEEDINDYENIRTIKDEEGTCTRWIINLAEQIKDHYQLETSINPNAAEYATFSKYKYNEDTDVVVVENLIKDYILVFYVYSEPDY